MRTLSALFILSLALPLRAQVACDIIAPAGMEASFENSWAEPAAGSWATPDMNDVANRVVADAALAVDATASDSLCCAPIANASEISGKIAVLYRGTCDYSEKALFCQNAGAVGVVIINNIAGAPAGMGAGSQGTAVTIPVFQIRIEDGAALRAMLDAGNTITMLLGNKNGFFASDIGIDRMGVLMPPSLATPSLLAAGSGEFLSQVGAWVHNFGSDPRTGITLSAVVTHNGSSVYDESSAAFDLAAGDSVFITLPDFTQNSFNGRYSLEYSVTSADPDQHLLDNGFSVPFEFEDLYALAPTSETTGIPVTTIGYQPATSSGEYESCIHFRDANADRVAISGVERYASITDPLTLDGELVFTRVYQWLDNFTGLSDPNFGFTAMVEVYNQKHILETTEGQLQTFLQYDEPVVLENNIRYVICTSTFNPEVFFGYNEQVNYATNEVEYDQPTSPNRNGTNWFVGFVGGPTASIGVRMIDANTIGFAEHTNTVLAPYPNPSKGIFHLSLAGLGATTITVNDAAGRTLATHRASDERYTLDLRGEAAGVYMITVESEKGRAVGRLVLE